MSEVQLKMQFAAVMAREFPSVAMNELLEVMRLLSRNAKVYHGLQVKSCNRGLNPKEQKREKNLEAGFARLAGRLPGCGVFLNDDPRGACVKLRLPSGACNSLDGGYCVP